MFYNIFPSGNQKLLETIWNKLQNDPYLKPLIHIKLLVIFKILLALLTYGEKNVCKTKIVCNYKELNNIKKNIKLMLFCALVLLSYPFLDILYITLP